jgi:DNA repair protein RadA/Sms
MLVEVQALVATGQFARRFAQGLDSNRLNMLIAVLMAHAGLKLEKEDVYASVVGGLRLDDPGTDLAVALAIMSMKGNAPIADDVVAIGEVGLSGEVRKAPYVQKRLAEAQRMGFRRAIVSRKTAEGPEGIELLHAGTIGEAIKLALESPILTKRKHAKARSVNHDAHITLQPVD